MKKTIVIFSSHRSLESGGVGTHLRHLGTELSKSMYDYRIVLGLKKSSLIKLKLANLVNRFFLGRDSADTLYFIGFIIELQKRLSKELESVKSDSLVIHTHDKYTAIAASIFKRSRIDISVKVIQTLHAPFYEQFKITHKNNNDLITISKLLDIGMTASLDDIIGVDSLQVKLAKNLVDVEVNPTSIANAVDIDQLENIKMSEEISKNLLSFDKYFVIARHLQEKNGVIFGVQGFHKFLDTNGSFGLVILGDGPDRENIEKYIDENGLSKQVKILGKQPHKDSIKIISKAYASIIPSIPVGNYIEATSLTMLESMYLEVPVLASNIGGLAEVIDHQVNGLVFEPSNIGEINNSLIEITSNDVLYARIKENAKNTILDSFTSARWFNKIKVYYEN